MTQPMSEHPTTNRQPEMAHEQIAMAINECAHDISNSANGKTYGIGLASKPSLLSKYVMHPSRILVFSIALLIMGSVRAQDELYYGGFRGKWEGQLRLIDPNAYHSEIGGGTAGQVFEASFEVSGEKVRVFWGKHRTEVKPGSFHLRA